MYFDAVRLIDLKLKESNRVLFLKICATMFMEVQHSVRKIVVFRELLKNIERRSDSSGASFFKSRSCMASVLILLLGTRALRTLDICSGIMLRSSIPQSHV